VAGENACGSVCEAARDSVSILRKQHRVWLEQPPNVICGVGWVVGDVYSPGRHLVPPLHRRPYQMRLKRGAAVGAEHRLERSANVAAARSSGHDQDGGIGLRHRCSNR
jgi:hypothetical protein